MKAHISNRSCWIIAEKENQIEVIVERSLTIACFSVLGILEHKFTPNGYTKIWLLGESHAALHSFPEESAIYVEISSCIEEKYSSFWKALNSLLVEEKIEMVPNILNSYYFTTKLNT